MYSDLKTLCIESTRSFREAMAIMDKTRLGIVLAVDTNNHLLGTITDGDARRAVLANVNFDSPVQDILDRKKGTAYAKPITAPLGLDKADYLSILKEHGVIHLPLLDKKGGVAGVVSVDELLPDRKISVKAVLMAGGAGKRLRPLTLNTPKPMLPVGNKPLMEIIINKLRSAGIRNVKISTHHKKEEIVNYFQDGKKFDVDVSYIDEEKPLGTAGALSLLEKTKDTLLVMNGDILTDMDFKAMIAYHKEHKADLTVAVRKYDVKVPYGVIECNDHEVEDIIEKPVYDFFVNAGIYLMEPHCLNLISKSGEALDMPELIKRLIEKKRSVASFPIMEQWIDIGQREDYDQAQKLVKNWSGIK